MQIRFVLVSAACIALLAAGSSSAEAATPGSPRHAIHLVNVDVRVLAEEVASATGKTMIVDPRVKGQVTLDTKKPLTANELYEAFVRVLSEQGWSVKASRSGVIKITPRAGTSPDTDDSGLISI